MFHQIVVCFDGSDHAAAALRIAAGLAKCCHAKLQIVHVPEVYGDAVAVGTEVVFMPMDEADIKARAEAALTEATEIAATAGQTDVTTHILRGATADAILAHANATHADLIVVGRRGFGPLRGLLLGSVSQKLSSHAACPVMTVQ